MKITRVYGIKMYEQGKKINNLKHDKIFKKHAVTKDKLEFSEEAKKLQQQKLTDLKPQFVQ